MADLDDRRQHLEVVRFMMECGVKLRMSSVPQATAAMIYHKFFNINRVEDYDPYLIGMTSLYLAGKIEEEHLKIRDVINASYRTMYKGKPPLDIGSTYWSLRDSLVQCELFVMRMLEFQVSFTHPHKYMLQFLKSLYDWLEPAVKNRVPIARTAWALLKDSYLGHLCLRYDPKYIAVSTIYLALQCYGVTVPYTGTAGVEWYQAFCEDLTIQTIRKIISEMIDIYQLEQQSSGASR